MPESTDQNATSSNPAGTARFSMDDVVWITIHETSDSGLLHRFFLWSIDQQIFPAITAGATGLGRHLSAYSPTDAAKIKQWLVENGAVECERLTRSPGL